VHVLDLIVDRDDDSLFAHPQNRRIITDSELDRLAWSGRELARQLRDQRKLAAHWAAPRGRSHAQPMVARFTGMVTMNTVPRGWFASMRTLPS